MRIAAIQIKNYKSIKDTGKCYLSDKDAITVLAGQNESGKSSILQAIIDFEKGELHKDAGRLFPSEPGDPEVTCTFSLSDSDKKHLLSSEVEQGGGVAELYADVQKLLAGKAELVLCRTFSQSSADMLFAEDVAQEVQQVIDKFQAKLDAEKESEVVAEVSVEATVSQAPVPAVAGSVAAATVAPAPVVSVPAPAQPQAVPVVELPTVADISTAVHRYTPAIVFFDDQQDLLPKSILAADLENKKEGIDGYNAVANLQSAFGLNLLDLDKASSRTQRASKTEDYNKIVTADFREYWSQKIHGNNTVDIEIAHYEGSGNGGEFEFYVLTKEQERLYPAQRSRGFQWYLSFYLELKAQSKRNGQQLVILFDEPGLYLHAKAQTDIKKLFEELGKNGSQIIYSTHSPYLIDVDKLNRVRLILNDADNGTMVEKITSDKLRGKKLDSLKPIIDAMGLEVASYLTPINPQNVIVEGISDFYYFTAFKKLLEREGSYGFLPSQGALNCHLLMELCIGWGIEWHIVFDDDHASKEAQQKITEQFEGEDVQDRLSVIKDCEGIENLLLPSDIKLVTPSRVPSADEDKSKFVQENCGGKELFARLFLDKVNSGDITASKLTKHARDGFTKVFDEFEQRFSTEPAVAGETAKAAAK